MKRIKLPEDETTRKMFAEFLQKSREELENRKEKELLPTFIKIGDQEIEIDYIRYFGTNEVALKMYPEIKKLKDDAELTYEQIINLKWENIDFENHCIKIWGHTNTNKTFELYNR